MIASRLARMRMRSKFESSYRKDTPAMRVPGSMEGQRPGDIEWTQLGAKGKQGRGGDVSFDAKEGRPLLLRSPALEASIAFSRKPAYDYRCNIMS